MITLTDMNGNIHDSCPRCGSTWRSLKSPDYFMCTGCAMMACLHTKNPQEYFLSIIILGENREYTIYWQHEGCLVDIQFIEGEEVILNAHLPLLPFDITLSKLQTYLVFS